MNHCKSEVEIFQAEKDERQSKTGKSFHILKTVCKVNTDDGEILAGNIEFMCDSEMPIPAPGKYHVRYEPRRDWQDGKIKPQVAEFVSINPTRQPPQPHK